MGQSSTEIQDRARKYLHEQLRDAIADVKKNKQTPAQIEEIARDAREIGGGVLEAHRQRIGEVLAELEEKKSVPERSQLDKLASEFESLDEMLSIGESETYASRSNFLFMIQTYSMMMTLVYGSGIFLGSMLGAFLRAMGGLTEGEERRGIMEVVLIWVFMPLYIFVGSVFIMNCYRALANQFFGQSFGKFRALMLGFLMQNNGCGCCRLDLAKACHLVEMWFRFVYCAICVVTCVWCSMGRKPGAVLGIVVLCVTIAAGAYKMRPQDAHSGPLDYVLSFHCTLCDQCLRWITGSATASFTDYASYWVTLAIVAAVCCYYSNVGDTFTGLALGNMNWGALTLLLYTLCDMDAALHGVERLGLVLGLEAVINKASIKPGEMIRKYPSLEVVARQLTETERPGDDDEEDEPEPPTPQECCWKVLTSREFCHWLGLMLALALAISVALHFLRLRWMQQSSYLLVVSCWNITGVYWLLVWCMRKMPSYWSKRMIVFLTLLVSIIDFCVLLGLKDGPFAPYEPDAAPLQHGSDPWIHDSMDLEPFKGYPPYPACLMKLGAHQELRVLDLAILSSYAYAYDENSFQKHGDVTSNTTATFTDDEIQVEIIAAQNYTVGRIVAFRFTKTGESSKGTTVLVVKGSSTPSDFYTDTNLWSMIATLQAFMPFIPILDAMPETLTASILYHLSVRSKVEYWVFENIRDTHAALKEDYPNDVFILSGHSLGGGIATVAAGQIGVTSVAFSGPGSRFSRWRFNTTSPHAHRTGVDIKPMVDWFHKVDRHDEWGGYIQCRDPVTGEKRLGTTCHSIKTTTCELWRACGDHRRRDFKGMCQELVGDLSFVGKVLGPND